jgi:hypothetical protein
VKPRARAAMAVIPEADGALKSLVEAMHAALTP